MAKSKAKKISQENPKDIDSLKSDVASFASSLGLASSSLSATSGFNDSDFRKTGPLKPSKKIQKPKLSNPSKTPQNKHNEKNNKHKPQLHPKVQPSPVETEISNSYSKGFDKFKNLPKLPLLKASSLGIWYEDLDELEPKVIGEGKKVEAENAEELKRLAETKKKVGERLLFQYTRDFLSTEGKRGDIKRLLNLQGKSLTSMDKVSANVVLVEENPIANMSSLDKLLVMVTSKAGKRHALTAFDALRELFTSRLLPDRKLKTLLQRPVNHLPDSKDGNSVLLFWYWEECLKERYYSFIVALEEASRDMLPVLKDKASKSIYSLLKSKPEEERRLLSALINKLGDPQSKGASNADFHLSNLLAEHPYMQSVVIDEVDSFLFRPHLGLQSKYHAVNFLSQVRLSHKGDGPKVAKRLIDVYFALFKVLISEASGGQKTDKKSSVEDKKTSNSYKDGKDKNSAESHVEMDSRLLSALLTGVNRAFPFVSSNEADDIIEVQTPMLFQLVHSENFNVGIQALMLLDKISSKNQVVSDRYYRALYSKLLLPAAMKTSKEDMFIGLLLRAMKTDVNLKRVSAFSKRLLQVALQQPPQYACGCLFLLSEVLKARPPLWNMVLQNESNDDDLEHFEDIVDETENESRTASKKSRITKGFVHDSDIIKADGNSSEDENVAATSCSEDDVPDKGEDLVMTDSQKPADVNGHRPPVPNLSPSLPGGYNPRHREPSYCNADRVSWWELMVLASHVHPSVATMASTLLSGAHIVYNGNPLKDLSMPAFLDKFMEKKAKTSTWHGASQIEPAKQLDMSSSHLIGPEILLLAEGDVNPEDLVFHKFYAHKMSSTKKPKKKKKRGAEDEAAEDLYGMDDGGGDESDNEEIDNMLDSVNPTVETSGDYDYDDLDQIANEDDEDLLRDDDDLVGDLSDAELDIPSDIGEGEDIDVATADGDWSDDDEDGISIGDADDGSGEDDDGIVQLNQKKRKRKSGGSVFASAEDYEHLINQDLTNEDSSPAEKAPVRRKKPKSAEKAPERRQNPKSKQQKKKKKSKKSD